MSEVVMRADVLTGVETDLEGAEDAFRRLSARHVESAFKLAYAILGNAADAEDASQDAFTAAWRQRHALRDPGRFDAWFGRILVNVCRDRLRHRSVARRLAMPAEPRPIADASATISDRDALDRSLSRLDPDQRIVVILRFWAGMSQDEIAERLDVPAGTVKSRLHRAMAHLRDALGSDR